MNDAEHTDRPEEDAASQEPQRPAEQRPSEIHREREIIVTGGGAGGGRGRGSGPSTAIVAIFALVALGIVAFMALAYFGGDGWRILPGDRDIDIEIEVPVPSVPAPEGGS
jgi:hypothetical protein